MARPFYNRHAQSIQHAPSSASHPSPSNPLSALRFLASKLASLVYTLVWMDLNWLITSPPPLALADTYLHYGGECHYEDEEQVEQCTTRYTDYSFSVPDGGVVVKGLALTTTTAAGGGGAPGGCVTAGQLTIVPYNASEMYLFVVEYTSGKCMEPSQKRWSQPGVGGQLEWGEAQVSDCNQTSGYYRRRRSDLDYTRMHSEACF
jgi:hypothetical protein